jgi:hypothetical protein
MLAPRFARHAAKICELLPELGSVLIVLLWRVVTLMRPRGDMWDADHEVDRERKKPVTDF